MIGEVKSHLGAEMKSFTEGMSLHDIRVAWGDNFGELDQRAGSLEQAMSLAMLALANKASLDNTGKIPLSQLPDSIKSGLSFQDNWNAATNTPAIPMAATANKGWYYRVGVAGNTNINGETDWAVGDWIVSNGSAWVKADNSQAPCSSADVAAALQTLTQLQLATLQAVFGGATITDAQAQSNSVSGLVIGEIRALGDGSNKGAQVRWYQPNGLQSPVWCWHLYPQTQYQG